MVLYSLSTVLEKLNLYLILHLGPSLMIHTMAYLYIFRTIVKKMRLSTGQIHHDSQYMNRCATD